MLSIVLFLAKQFIMLIYSAVHPQVHTRSHVESSRVRAHLASVRVLVASVRVLVASVRVLVTSVRVLVASVRVIITSERECVLYTVTVRPEVKGNLAYEACRWDLLLTKIPSSSNLFLIFPTGYPALRNITTRLC